MDVTLAQADALEMLRTRGFELSNLRPHGRAVVADTLRGKGETGMVVIAPSGRESHELNADLLEGDRQTFPIGAP